jgi:energy-coupling factor transporter ATP-binding protein EcfA2
MLKKNKKNQYINQNLLDRLAPSRIDFRSDRSSFVIDENFARSFVLYSFPLYLPFGWLSKIAKIKNVSVSVFNKPVSVSSVQETLSKTLKNITMETDETDLSKSSIDEIMVKSGQTINEKMLNEQQKPFYTTIVCTVYGNSENELNDYSELFRDGLSGLGISSMSLVDLQEEGAMATLPYAKMNKEISEYNEHLFLSPTIAGSFMYDNTLLKDENGFILGKDESSNIVVFDMWKRDKTTARNNSNFVVIGESGVGKSTTMKSLIINEYAEGTTIIIIDPEREYKDICEKLDGQWINMSGGENKINYFEVMGNTEEDDDKDEEKINAYEETIRKLRTFFKIYLKDLSDADLSKLEEIIENEYKKKDIGKDTDFSKLNPTDYFVAEDLYNSICELQDEMRKSDKGYTDTELDRIENIRLGIKKIANGVDSSMFNGQTNIMLDSDFIVFDIYDLQNADEGLKRLQYTNIMSFATARLMKNRNEKVLLVIDEGHMLIDKDVIDTVKSLRQTQKRVRKYNSAMGIASQEINDFLHENVKD